MPIELGELGISRCPARFGGFRLYRLGRYLPAAIAGNRASDIPVALSILDDGQSVICRTHQVEIAKTAFAIDS